MANLKRLNKIHTLVSFSYRNNSPSVSVYLQSFETGEWEMCKTSYYIYLHLVRGWTDNIDSQVFKHP